MAHKPKDRYDTEQRMKSLYQHAINYDIPDKDKVAILREALAVIPGTYTPL